MASESAAIALVRKFKDAHGLIIDVRGNLGGGPSPELQAALMGRPIGRGANPWDASALRKAIALN